MPSLSSSQLPPPSSWDEFEDLCADLFMNIWEDQNIVRCGRSGQSQNGVDIYSIKNAIYCKGVQCKGKRVWPPTLLTTKEIDDEVKLALKFEPPLKELIFTTIAPDDVQIQTHARKITEEHSKSDLFSVHVFGWNELRRRITLYPQVFEKYYGFTSIGELARKIDSISLVEQPIIPVELVENFVSNEIKLLKKKRYYPRFNFSEACEVLAKRISSGDLSSSSPKIKSSSLSWLARAISLSNIEMADNILKLVPVESHCEETIIAEAFIEASKSLYDDAWAKLSGLSSSNAKTALFILHSNWKGPFESIEWIKKAQIPFKDLEPNGKYIFLINCIKAENWDAFCDSANTLVDDDFNQVPALLFLSGIANIIPAVPDELKQNVLHTVPFELCDFPLATDNQSLLCLRKAKQFFTKFEIEAKSLGFDAEANIASDYVVWLQIKDPETVGLGVTNLKNSLRDPAHSLRRLNFAYQFNIDIDPEAVVCEIDRQMALAGGNSFDAGFARFILTFYQDSPDESVNYLRKFRSEISKYIQEFTLLGIEVQLLAKAGRVEEAQKCIEELKQFELAPEVIGRLNQSLELSTSDNPVRAKIDAFQQDSSIFNLMELVQILDKGNDSERLIQYAEILFEKTHSINEAKVYFKTMFNLGHYSNVIKWLGQYSEFLDQSDDLMSIWCWSNYFQGDIIEAEKWLNVVRKKRDHINDRNLEINFLIASGNWDNLGSHLEFEWKNQNSRSSNELLQSAHLAQKIGSQRTMQFVQAAIQKSNNDPNVLLTAYSIATDGGWEDQPEVGSYLLNAIALSDNVDTGYPIKRMSLKEVVDLQPDWQNTVKETTHKLFAGDIPIFAAAKLLNRSLFEFTLMPALANINEPDPRKRKHIFAYSGKRQAVDYSGQIIGLDATSLLTLNFLEILEMVFDSFDKVVIPHSTLHWLFEEKGKIKFHQPSRIQKAKELRQMVDEGVLKIFTKQHKTNFLLASDIGETLEAFFTDARVEKTKGGNQRVIVRSNPIHRVSSLMDEVADISEYQDLLCSCTSLIDKLKQKGQITAGEEAFARSYLKVNEFKWPDEPEIEDGAIIYLDDLSVSYLQHLGLLRKISMAGLKAYISESEYNESKSLIRYESVTSLISKHIENLRRTLANGIRSGKIFLGPMPLVNEDDQYELRVHPTLSSLDIVPLTDFLVVDDRFMNSHRKIETNDKSTPVASSWDLLIFLNKLGKINLNQLFEKKTLLRKCGYLFVPIDEIELNHYLHETQVYDGKIIESAELKAIRENILQSQMSRALKMPEEENWLNSLINVLTNTIFMQWSTNIHVASSKARSNWLFQFMDLRDWMPSIDEITITHSKNIRNYDIQLAHRFVMPKGTATQVKEKYLEWVQEAVLTNIEENNPEAFTALVKVIEKSLFETLQPAIDAISSEFPNSNITKRSLLVCLTQNLSESIQSKLLSDKEFKRKFQVEDGIVANITLGDTGISINQSDLRKAVGEYFKDESIPIIIRDSQNNEWSLECIEKSLGKFALLKENNRLLLPELWALLPTSQQRQSVFDVVSRSVNLPTNRIEYWKEKLEQSFIDDGLLLDLLQDIRDTPIAIQESLSELFDVGISKDKLVPESTTYFERLIGNSKDFSSLQKFTETSLVDLISELIDWNPKEGLSLAFLFSVHPDIKFILANEIKDEDIFLEFLESIVQNGDIVSQLGALEVGLLKLQDWRKITDKLVEILRQLILAIQTDGISCFNTLNSIFIFVDAQLSALRFFESSCPSIRRFASITHSALILRCLSGRQVDSEKLTSWLELDSKHDFYLQNFCDLRSEPDWIPNFATSENFRALFIRRIVNTARFNNEIITSIPDLYDLIFNESISGLATLIEYPMSYLPNPLDGMSEKTDMPAELDAVYQDKISRDNFHVGVVESIFNASFIFSMDAKHVNRLIELIKNNHTIFNNNSTPHEIFSILFNLSAISTVNRNKELAEKIFHMIYDVFHSSEKSLTMFQAFWLILTCAAHEKELFDWCKLIGERIKILSFENCSKEDAELLYWNINKLQNIVPGLYSSLSIPKAAVKAVIGM